MTTKTEKAPFIGISSIQAAIENMKLPYDYKHTASILVLAATKTQRRLASKRKYMRLIRYAPFKSRRLKIG